LSGALLLRRTGPTCYSYLVIPGLGVSPMRRREFITLLGSAAAAWPLAARAQTAPKAFRLGTLMPGLPLDEKNPLGAVLLKALEQHGYVLGKNLSLDARGAGGQVSKLGELVRGLKANQVNVIVAAGFPVILACKVANMPTVVAFGGVDPVATHLIDALARPAAISPAFPITRLGSRRNA
jgi:putative tryptophan/tyrosine transport system substrate-binding protein